MKLKIGTRGSPLALYQAQLVEEALKKEKIATELVIIKTKGDIEKTKPLSEIRGKGIFTRALEEALLEKKIDLAIHSLKDVPVEEKQELSFAAFLKREDPRDAFVSFSLSSFYEATSWHTIGTGSERRKAFLSQINSKPQILPLRGNLETRIRKCEQGMVQGLVLAAAGLHRLKKQKLICHYFEPEELPPAPGQGIVAVQIRTQDRKRYSFLKSLNHEETCFCAYLERELLKILGRGCELPFGALCQKKGKGFLLQASLFQNGKTKHWKMQFQKEEVQKVRKAFQESLLCFQKELSFFQSFK